MSMGVEDIVREAGSFAYNANIPLRYWLRTADAIQKQAQSYERDGNEQDAYLFYFRHALLVMEKLSGRPDVKLAENQTAWKKANQDVNSNLSKLEVLKPAIQKKHEQYVQIDSKRKEERAKWAQDYQQSRYDQATAADFERMSLEQAHPKSGRRELEPGENRDLAVKLAHGELRKSRWAKSQPRSGRYDRSTVSFSSDRFRTALAQDRDDNDDDDDDDDSDGDLSSRIIAVGRRGEQALLGRNEPRRDESRRGEDSSASLPSNRAPHYPNVPPKSKHDLTFQPLSQSSTPQSSFHDYRPSFGPDGSLLSTPPPGRPPKLEYFDDSHTTPPPLPPLPVELQASTPPPQQSTIYEAPDTGLVELDSKDYSFKPTAFTEGEAPLRTIFINPKLRSRFLTIALTNTERNLETCGILCGTLISNAFFISKLVIPEQESTSDTCDTVNEGALFDYCDSENLLTLGWIHTHPTQTCFMSSRDLHTHGGYQVQLPESIAIVCAPKHDPSWGIFRLTDPPGLKTVLNCRQTGIFHPHSESNIYTDALKPGHVWELPGLEFDVVDLRPNSTWI